MLDPKFGVDQRGVRILQPFEFCNFYPLLFFKKMIQAKTLQTHVITFINIWYRIWCKSRDVLGFDIPLNLCIHDS